MNGQGEGGTYFRGTGKGSVAPVKLPIEFPSLAFHEIREDPPQILIVGNLEKVQTSHVTQVGGHFCKENGTVVEFSFDGHHPNCFKVSNDKKNMWRAELEAAAQQHSNLRQEAQQKVRSLINH